MKTLTIPLLDAVPDSENSREFHTGMVARMEQSYFKYGAVADAVGKHDFIASLKVRLQRYEETGNTEWLMDVASYAMMEFMHPQHDAAHFRATDSDESPGNFIIATGELAQTANTIAQENIRLGGSALVTSGGFYQREGD